MMSALGPTYHPTTLDKLRADLRGFDLGCNCEPDQPFHGDVLLGLANQ